MWNHAEAIYALDRTHSTGQKTHQRNRQLNPFPTLTSFVRQMTQTTPHQQYEAVRKTPVLFGNGRLSNDLLFLNGRCVACWVKRNKWGKVPQDGGDSSLHEFDSSIP